MSREDPQMKIRITDELREKLRLSAHNNGRSLNSEIALRLEQTYEIEADQLISNNYLAWLESGGKGKEPEMPVALRRQNFRVSDSLDAEIDARRNNSSNYNDQLANMVGKIDAQNVVINRTLSLLEELSSKINK